MRFIPTTHMASQGECITAYANSGVSGSFVSGSRTFRYHEFTCPNVSSSLNTQFVIESGFTKDARVIMIAGGGGGGWNGTDMYGLGGGGGGGEVIDLHNVFLYPSTYSVYVGHGGDPADADNPNPVYRTFNGGDGDFSRIISNIYTLQVNGGKGGYGDNRQPGTYLHGGNSGNGFTGGVNDGYNSGGGAGVTSNGLPGTSSGGGNGGDGLTITLPYTSPTYGSTTKDVGGGGGGSADFSDNIGLGRDGGGNGGRRDTTNGDTGERYTGGGGGGSKDYAATPPAGIGTRGGDGIIIIYYPITDCP